MDQDKEFIVNFGFVDTFKLGIDLNSSLVMKMRRYKNTTNKYRKNKKVLYSILVNNYYHRLNNSVPEFHTNYYESKNTGHGCHMILTLVDRKSEKERSDFMNGWIKTAREIYNKGIENVPERYKDFVIKPEMITKSMILDFRNIVRNDVLFNLENDTVDDQKEELFDIRDLIQYYNNFVDPKWESETLFIPKEKGVPLFDFIKPKNRKTKIHKKEDITTDQIRCEDPISYELSNEIMSHCYNALRKMVIFSCDGTHKESFYDLTLKLCKDESSDHLDPKTMVDLYEDVLDPVDTICDINENFHLLFGLMLKTDGKDSDNVKSLAKLFKINLEEEKETKPSKDQSIETTDQKVDENLESV